eukprot:2183898-Amphidinium_carterae.1
MAILAVVRVGVTLEAVRGYSMHVTQVLEDLGLHQLVSIFVRCAFSRGAPCQETGNIVSNRKLIAYRYLQSG